MVNKVTVSHPSLYIVTTDRNYNKRIAGILRELGSIHVVDSLDQFMIHHRQDQPDIIILDSTLPALEATIKTLKTTPNAPIMIVLTAPDEDDIERWLKAGADDVYIKPLVPALLRKRVLRLVALRTLTAPGEHTSDTIASNTAQSEDDYKNVFLAANDAIMILDVMTGTFVDANTRASKMFGYSRDAFTSLRAEDLYASVDEEGELARVNLTSKGSFIYESVYLTQSGREIPVEVSSRLTRYRGRMVMLNFVRDITKRKLIQQAEIEQRRLAEALRHNAALINNTLKLNTVIDRLLKQIYVVIDCDAVNLVLLEGERARIIGHHGYDKFTPFNQTAIEPGWEISHFESMQQVVEQKQPICISDTRKYSKWKNVEGATWILSHASVPILYDDAVIGLLNLDDSNTDAFDENTIETLQVFANQAGIAIRNARLYEQVQTHAEMLEKHVAERTAELMDTNAELKEQIATNARIEAQLLEERTLLRTVIDTVPDDVYVKDMDGQFVLVNRHVEESISHHVPDGQLLGKTIFDLLPYDDAVTRKNAEDEMFRTGEPIINQEIRNLPDDEGKTTIVWMSKVPLRDKDGNLKGLVGVNRDVTELRRLDKERTRERHLLRTVIDHIPDDVYVKDTKGRFVLVNAVVEQRLSTYLDEGQSVIGTTNADYMPEERRKLRDETEKSVIDSGEPLINDEVEIVLADGKVHQQLATKVPLHDEHGNIVGLLGINRDITEIKETTKTLERERALLRTLLDNLPDRIYVKDRQGRFILANRATRDFHEGKDIIGKTDLELSPEDVALPAFNAEQELMANGTMSPNMLHKETDGKGWLLITKAPLHNAEGEVIGLVGINRNITEVKRSQDKMEELIDELRSAEERLQHLITGARALLWYAIITLRSDVPKDDPASLDWQVHVSSEAAAHQFLPVDQKPDESYVDAWQRSIFDDDKAQAEIRSREAIFSDQAGYQQELRCRRSDDDVRWLFEDVRITPLTDGRWSAVGICTDITERKLAEQALRDTNELLEDRVATRTRELTRANALERAQRILAEALSDAAAALSSSLSLDDVLDRILTYAARVMPTHDASNVLLIEEDNYARVIRARSYTEAMGNYESITDDSYYLLDALPTIETIIETGDTVTVRVTDSPPAWLQSNSDKPIRSYISAPIFTGGHVTGVISFGSTQAYRFNPNDADRLLSFTNQAGIAIRNAQLYEAVVNQASELEEKVNERTLELELERRQLGAILNGMTEGVIYYDIDGRMRYVNQSLEQLTRFPAKDWEETEGFRLILDLPEDERAAFMMSMLKEVNTVGISRREVAMMTKTGNPFTASMTISAVHDDIETVVGYVFVVRDISKEKQLENQKSRFIANASHELRTPLTNIKTRLYLISHQPEKMDEHLEVMNTVTNRMRNLVNDLLDVSRFENNMIQLDAELQPIQAVIEDVIHVQNAEAKQKAIALIDDMPDTPIDLMLDYSRIHQVMTNLVINAIHYTERGGTITVSIAEQESFVHVRVRDTGQGIPAEILPTVFEPFIRGQESHEYKGAGLGLSISRDIIALHGGEISVESEEGVGTTFTVTFDKTYSVEVDEVAQGDSVYDNGQDGA